MEASRETTNKVGLNEHEIRNEGVVEENVEKNNAVLAKNVFLLANSPVSEVLNKSFSSPNRRMSGSPLSIIRNFASLSNRGSPPRTSSNKGSPFTKFFGKVSLHE